MNHRIQCQCGALTGEVSNTHSVMHAVCYCIDCRTYAFHLGKPESVLDANGGTEVIATQAKRVTFTAGAQHLACLSLSPNGLLRWYAQCCNTPIANTPRNWRLPYVGLIHSCLNKPLESSFPAVQIHVNTQSVKTKLSSTRWAQITTLLGFMPKILLARFTGAYKETPFFSSAGVALVNVQILSKAEREQAKSAAIFAKEIST